MNSSEQASITFRFRGAKILERLARLRGDRPLGRFLKECLVQGLVQAEKSARQPLAVTLERARPAFRGLTATGITEVLKEGDKADPVYGEVSRLVKAYAPVLAPKASALRPAGLMRLDVRCPIEQVAAGLAFRMLKGVEARNVTIH